VRFLKLNLDTGDVPLPSASADMVTCLETIEHVENPRALMRELYRLVRPGGSVLVTTPNQLSLLSKLCLVVKNEFVHFQERPGLYPAHISALLEIDLVRMCREVGLTQLQVRYTGAGRMPFSAATWPSRLGARTGFRGRTFSDNVLVLGRKPH
jgi:2-polyprenyl-3-methyl-5-hydroxy-6-metoxy-1,4-benzoquinol methylase